MRRLLIIFVLILLVRSPAQAADVAAWVGAPAGEQPPAGAVVYHKSFTIDFDLTSAYLKFTCCTPEGFDGTQFRAFVDGVEVRGGSWWQDAGYVSLSKVLRQGRNDIDIEVTWTDGGACGPVLAKLVARGKDKDGKGKSVEVRSDDSWVYYTGKFDLRQDTKPSTTTGKVAVFGTADTWKQASSPLVMPKLDAGTVVGVTGVGLSAGDAGSRSQFSHVKDLSDKFYVLNALGCRTIEGRIFGQTIYQPPGQWFWGYDKEVERSLERAEFDFCAEPWVWLPPEWYATAHGLGGGPLSIWSPDLDRFNQEVYSGLKENFPDRIKSICAGIYGDYGEAAFPLSLSDSASRYAGFWAGDALARADFKSSMLKKYGSVNALNAAWRTAFSSADEIAYPRLDGSDCLRYVLDFVDWYFSAMTEFAAKVCRVVRQSFPDTPIVVKLGSGEDPVSGQDDSALVKALAGLGVTVRAAPGRGKDLGFMHIASACKFYGASMEMDLGDAAEKVDEARGLFLAAGSGCSSVFAQGIDALRQADVFSRCRRNLRGDRGITDVALFFPTTRHRLDWHEPYPPKLAEAAGELRDMLDFDVVDERMVLDGALERYRVPAIFDGDVLEQNSFNRIAAWVKNGGHLVLGQSPLMNVEGAALPVSSTDKGKGGIDVWSGDWSHRKDLYGLIAQLAGSPVDGKPDGVWTTLFKNRALDSEHYQPPHNGVREYLC